MSKKATQFGKRLGKLVQEIEDIREQKRRLAVAEDATFAQAHAEDFDAKTIRRVLAVRRQQREESAESRALFEHYLGALNMTEEATTPPLRRVGNVVPIAARKARK